MEIALQQESQGIRYEGYTKSFIQYIFEESDVDGRNERYEFRCDDDLQCCGRHCCIPEDPVIPLWLIIILIFIALLLLAAALAAYMCSKRRKPKPKKEKFVPSPIEEVTLSAPKPVKIVQRNENEISRVMVPQLEESATLNPQRAQMAFYRSQTEQIASYNLVE